MEHAQEKDANGRRPHARGAEPLRFKAEALGDVVVPTHVGLSR